ncbi:MAG TPA: hypothetical protein VGN26_07230 [Armatimonadota bacterium]|jgi:hypothetical protein
MSREVFAEWLRRQGHRVVHTESSLWYDASPHIFQAFPYHALVMPSEEEVRALLTTHRALALRYSAPLALPLGHISYHSLCTDRDYGLSVLQLQARQRARQGLAYASVERVSFSRLAHEGWALRKDTLVRQGRRGAESQAWWKELCLSCDGLDGFEAWAALHEGELVAAILAFVSEGCCSLLYQQSSSPHMRKGVNNALTYAVTREMLSRPDVERVFYGLHSLDAPPSVDEYKFHMGYRPMPVRQRVVLHPVLSPLVNGATHSLVSRLASLRPQDSILAKTEGMMRFFLEGRRPLGEQLAPKVLKGELAKCLRHGR